VSGRSFSSPARLSSDDDIGEFRSGDDGVDSWLRDQARDADASGTARTYVVKDGVKVVAYYCLSNAVIRREELASAKARRGMPAEVPAILLGQLGVDIHYQRHGLGRYLLRDAIGRVLHASEISGIAVMHLHTGSDAARDYYLQLGLGFLESRSNPGTLYLPIATIRKALLPE
jgi:GNAT superfamily N-acetyltransferase